MSWTVVAITAYVFLAFANLIDKFLVDNVITSSKAYTFVVCLMGGLIFLVSPWFLHWPGLSMFFLNILAGIIFAIALWLLYKALREGEASRILVLIGGSTPIFVVLFSVLSNKSFTIHQWIGISLLSVGVLSIAFLPKYYNFYTHLLKKIGINIVNRNNGFKIALLSALFYALFFLLSKYTYNTQEFLSAFIWNRLGTVLFVLLFLIRKKDRKNIQNLLKRPPKKKHQVLIVFNQGLGASGFMLQNYAIFLGPVALVNSLQGIQYALLLILSGVLSFIYPSVIKERFSTKIFIQKLIAIILIAIGLYFIV